MEIVKLSCLFLTIYSFYFQAFALAPSELFSKFKPQKIIAVFDQEEVDKERAQKWYQFYLGAGKEALEKQIQNAVQAKPLVEAILHEFEIPKELFFIALIESGFALDIESHRGAKGPWQFMPATARRYGLQVEEERDERVHLHKSTKAAAKYLKDLYHIFNDWTLAAAAYNAGEYRILDAIRNGKTRSYKRLTQGGFLPEETRDYVAKIWVVHSLFERADEFALKVPVSLNEEQAAWARISFDRSFPLATLAFVLDRSRDELMGWNPDLRNRERIVANTEKTYDFYLPLPDYQRWVFFTSRPFVTKVDSPEKLAQFGVTGVGKGDSVQMSLDSDGRAKIVNLNTGESHTIKLP